MAEEEVIGFCANFEIRQFIPSHSWCRGKGLVPRPPAWMVGPSTYAIPLTLQGEHEPHNWGLGCCFGIGAMDSVSAINSCLIWIYKTYKLLHYWAVKPSKDLNGQMPSKPVRAWGLGYPVPCFICHTQCLHIRRSHRFQALQWSFVISIFYRKKLKLKDEQTFQCLTHKNLFR